MFKSLLPNTYPATERAIDERLDAVCGLDFPNADLFNPDLCPAHLLGYLAWALSVDEWDDAWAESIKRNVCRMAMEVHRHKGTKHAIVQALASLDAAVDMVEWFEQGGAPYTASLVAYAGNNLDAGGNTLLTPALQEKLWRVVNAAKNARTHIDFSVGVGAVTKLFACAVVNTHVITRDSAVQTADYPVLAQLSAALFYAPSLSVERCYVACV